MAKATVRNFIKMIGKMQSERQQLQDRIDEIDGLFSQLGIAPASGGARTGRGPGRPKMTGPGRPAGVKQRGPGRPPKSAAGAAKRGPGRPSKGKTGKRYKVSGKEFLLSLMRGGSGASSSLLTKEWKKSGRSGTPFNMLGQLVRAGACRKTGPGGRAGSTYTAK